MCCENASHVDNSLLNANALDSCWSAVDGVGFVFAASVCNEARTAVAAHHRSGLGQAVQAGGCSPSRAAAPQGSHTPLPNRPMHHLLYQRNYRSATVNGAEQTLYIQATSERTTYVLSLRLQWSALPIILCWLKPAAEAVWSSMNLRCLGKRLIMQACSLTNVGNSVLCLFSCTCLTLATVGLQVSLMWSFAVQESLRVPC